MRALALLAAVMTATATWSGCGGSSRPARAVTRGATAPARSPTGRPAAAADVAVIRQWSTRLRDGDVKAAAALFALPSRMINGVGASGIAVVISIRNRGDAERANASLPCGARLLSAERRGKYVNALFRLTGRSGPGGTSCGSGAGSTARTNFVISHGRIVDWIRAPDDPGDNGSPRTPTPQSPTPASPSGAPSVVE